MHKTRLRRHRYQEKRNPGPTHARARPPRTPPIAPPPPHLRLAQVQVHDVVAGRLGHEARRVADVAVVEPLPRRPRAVPRLQVPAPSPARHAIRRSHIRKRAARTAAAAARRSRSAGTRGAQRAARADHPSRAPRRAGRRTRGSGTCARRIRICVTRMRAMCAMRCVCVCVCEGRGACHRPRARTTPFPHTR